MSKKYVLLFLLIALVATFSCIGLSRTAFAFSTTSTSIETNLTKGDTKSEFWDSYKDSNSSYFGNSIKSGAYYDANGFNSNNCTAVKR